MKIKNAIFDFLLDFLWNHYTNDRVKLFHTFKSAGNIFPSSKFFVAKMNAIKMNLMCPLEAEESKNLKIVRHTYFGRYIVIF